MNKPIWKKSAKEYCAEHGVVSAAGVCLEAAPWQLGAMSEPAQSARLKQRLDDRGRLKREHDQLRMDWAKAVKEAFLAGDCSLVDLYERDISKSGYDRAFYLLRDWAEHLGAYVPSPFRLLRMPDAKREKVLLDIEQFIKNSEVLK